MFSVKKQIFRNFIESAQQTQQRQKSSVSGFIIAKQRGLTQDFRSNQSENKITRVVRTDKIIEPIGGIWRVYWNLDIVVTDDVAVLVYSGGSTVAKYDTGIFVESRNAFLEIGRFVYVVMSHPFEVFAATQPKHIIEVLHSAKISIVSVVSNPIVPFSIPFTNIGRLISRRVIENYKFEIRKTLG